MEFAENVKIVITVPETHADRVREALGHAGAGQIGAYSYCSFSVKGIGRFRPDKGANPYFGHEGTLEEIVEERIETTCSHALLDRVLEEVIKAHPYEEPVIDIYPLYKPIAVKKSRS